MVNENNRAAVFSWITGLFSVSHVLGNVLARFLPEKYIFSVSLCNNLNHLKFNSIINSCYVINHAFCFQVSIALLIFCPVYMQIFLVETTNKLTTQTDHDLSSLTKTVAIIHKRYVSMRDAATIVMSRYLASSDCFHASIEVSTNLNQLENIMWLCLSC